MAMVHVAQRGAQVRSGSTRVRAQILIDSGASIHLFQTDVMRRVATMFDSSSSGALGYINGVGGRSPITALLGVRLHLLGGVRIDVKAPFAAAIEGGGATAQDIISTAKLYDETRIVTMLDPEPHLRTPEGTCVPLTRMGRYYMLEATISSLPADHDGVALVPETAASAAAHAEENEMWAARLCLSSRGASAPHQGVE